MASKLEETNLNGKGHDGRRATEEPESNTQNGEEVHASDSPCDDAHHPENDNGHGAPTAISANASTVTGSGDDDGGDDDYMKRKTAQNGEKRKDRRPSSSDIQEKMLDDRASSFMELGDSADGIQGNENQQFQVRYPQDAGNVTPPNNKNNIGRPDFLSHSDSLVISEIDSQYSPGLNDSRCTFDLLASIQSATQEIKEKRERLKEEGLPEKSVSQSSQDMQDKQHPMVQGSQEDVVASQNIADLPSRPSSLNPFVDLNTPIMMVPGQHLLLPQQLKQLQQVQQVSTLNYVHSNAGNNHNHHPHHHDHQSNSSSLTSPIYTTTTTTTSASSTATTAATQIHNGSHSHAVLLQAHIPSQPGVLQHPSGGRRTMKLRLMEEVHGNIPPHEGSKKSIFSRVSVLARRTRSMGSSDDFEMDDKSEFLLNGSPPKVRPTMDRGEISISWYDGTSTVELQDHVRKSIENKLRIGRKKLLLNLRIMDESSDPQEEIVLSPFIPDGSKFLVTFRVKDLTKKWQNHIQHHRAPPSPSAAPSPPGELEQELQRQISDVLNAENSHRRHLSSPPRIHIPNMSSAIRSNVEKSITYEQDRGVNTENDNSSQSWRQHEINDILAQRLEKLNDTLLLLHDEGTWAKDDPNVLKTEKKQVIFVIANYFVLFLSLIAISAEIHERAPKWMAWIDSNITTVQNCASDKDALFQCVSEGNFSGLIASVVLWASQSVATKRFFLFGFDSPKKLWRVVYECCVTSFCWGFSYIFIRRGLNPDTRADCVRKYWKDAVYGSLAGFNAAFMKAVLKNLLPQADEILDVMEHRQVRIVNFLGKIFKLIPGSQTSQHIS